VSPIRPEICRQPFNDGIGAGARCRKAPGHEGEHGYDGERGRLRWFLYDAPANATLRPDAEAAWRRINGDSEPEPKAPRWIYPGLLHPGERLVVKLDAPLASDRQPVLITPKPGDAVITRAVIDSDEIEILSKRDAHTIPFALGIVAKTVLNAATLPWRDMLGSVVAAIGDIASKLKR
jgi:hypothetical protein